MKTIINTLLIKNPMINIEPTMHKYNNIIDHLRNFRMRIMNNHENFCHAASIFRDDGKEQCFKLRYWL